MKAGNKYQYVHVVQVNYGHGWEDCAATLSRREACQDKRAYQENAPEYAARVITRRVLTEKYIEGDF